MTAAMRNLGSTRELDILILGPVPPPFGGVSVHVSRLVPLLEAAGLRVGVLNHFNSTEPDYVLGALKRNPVNYYRRPKKLSARVVHYHHSRWSTLVAVALGRRTSKARYMVTLHSPNISGLLESRIPLVGRVTEWALRSFDAIIVVSATIKTAIEDHVDRRRIVVLPAFLGASFDGFEYEDSIERFFAAGSVLLVAAYRPQLFNGGQDVYGLDTAIQAFAELTPERPDLRLALFIAERSSRPKEANHLRKLRQQVERLGLDERVLFAFGLPLVPAFRHDVVMVRPSRSDGDALSIREALQAGVPVVASDVVQRPKGTLTFPQEDIDALCATLRDVLDRPTHATDVSEARTRDNDSFYEGVIRMYRSQLALEAGERSRSPVGD